MKPETVLVLAPGGSSCWRSSRRASWGVEPSRTVDQVTALLERNEARFRAMVRDSNDIMAIVDPTGRLVYASPVTERILGLDIEPLIGTTCSTSSTPRTATPCSRVPDRSSMARRPIGSRCALQHADGTWRMVEAVATNLLDEPAGRGHRHQRARR